MYNSLPKIEEKVCLSRHRWALGSTRLQWN